MSIPAGCHWVWRGMVEGVRRAPVHRHTRTVRHSMASSTTPAPAGRYELVCRAMGRLLARGAIATAVGGIVLPLVSHLVPAPEAAPIREAVSPSLLPAAALPAAFLSDLRAFALNPVEMAVLAASASGGGNGNGNNGNGNGNGGPRESGVPEPSSLAVLGAAVTITAVLIPRRRR